MADITNEMINKLFESGGSNATARDYLRERRVYNEYVMTNYYGSYNPDTIPITTYSKMRLNPTIKLGLTSIKSPVKSAPRSFSCDDARAKAFMDEYVLPQIKDVIKKLLLSLDYGFSVLEIVWDDVMFDGKKYFAPVLFAQPDHQYVELMKTNGVYSGFKFNVIDVVAGKTLLATWDGDYGNLYGTSVMKPSYEAWRTSGFIGLQASRHLEQQGSPMPFVGFDAEKDADGNYIHKNEAVEIARNINSSGYAVIPRVVNQDTGEPMDLWTIGYVTGQTDGSQFDTYLNRQDVLMLRGLLIPDGSLTRGGSATGSYAERSEAVELMAYNLQDISDWIDSIVQKQLVNRVVRMNFGPKVVCKLNSEPVSREKQEFLNELTKSVIVSDKVSPEVKQLADDYYKSLVEGNLGH